LLDPALVPDAVECDGYLDVLPGELPVEGVAQNLMRSGTGDRHWGGLQRASVARAWLTSIESRDSCWDCAQATAFSM
jgi:hypothetical protein